VITHVHTGDNVAHRDDLPHSLVSDRISGRQRRSSPRDSEVEVTTWHQPGLDQSLLWLRDLRLGDVAPSVSPGLVERQLTHLSMLSDRSPIVPRFR